MGTVADAAPGADAADAADDPAAEADADVAHAADADVAHGADAALVRAARAGDDKALADLFAGHLPLVYNVVGRALNGHPDTDDVVQQTMLHAIQGLPGLREPERFRAWLISIAYRQVHDLGRMRGTALVRQRPLDAHAEAARPVDDFAEATIVRLGLFGERREMVEASRLLGADGQRVLALWCQEVAGSLTRAEVAGALGLSVAHTAVRIHRVKRQLDLARTVLRAWRAMPRCPRLDAAARGFPDGFPGGVPSGLPSGFPGGDDPGRLRRLGRHIKGCEVCGRAGRDLVPVERLFAGIAFLPAPLRLSGKLSALLGAAGPTSTMHSAGRPGPRREPGRRAGYGYRPSIKPSTYFSTFVYPVWSKSPVASAALFGFSPCRVSQESGMPSRSVSAGAVPPLIVPYPSLPRPVAVWWLHRSPAVPSDVTFPITLAST
ncbi:RNA polymerase sigma factor [Rugosimonospora africana]|uniref:RNA polymerase sigma factor n=1 Tax=Rugosimonospora africana TaxID=556532 RepID=UPI001EF2C97F|nr:sigma-70 family RNA polymerase sigma factor [Rugosimonospora africana]